MAKIKDNIRCNHVRGSCAVPGWGCCKCSTYNGYQRFVCKDCGHNPCYELESEEGREALELRPIGNNPTLVREWMSRRGAQVERPEQPVGSSGLKLVMLQAEGIRMLQEVLSGWDAMVAAVARLEADRQLRLESRQPKVKTRRSAGKRKRVA